MEKNIGKKQPSLLLLICLVGFPQISETIFTPSLPEIAQSYQVSMNTAQLTLSIYFLAFAFGVFFWGYLSDIVGRRPAMIYGIVLYGIGSLLCYISQSIEFLLLARFVQAFGASTGSVTTQTILREAFSGNKRHELFAQISAALAFTPAVGPLIGGFVGNYYGFRIVFLTLVLMSLVLFFYTVKSLPETFDTSKREKVELLPIFVRFLKNPKVLTYGFLIGTINGILFSYYAEAPFIFIEKFGISASIYGFLGIVIAGASIIGALLSKKLLKTYQPERIILLGIKIMLLGSTLLLVSSYTDFLSKWIQFTAILISVFITLLGTGTALPNCLSLALVDFKDVVGSAGAIFSLGYYLLVSLITFGMSHLHNGTLYIMPIYFISLGFIMLILTKRYIK
ncbi:multidrug effflux MFS transporter [Vagococcus carniphilus]|uniref:Bcr/CflA family efflux transporter n=1 Tax=Vagococcus carniphilus TaxID=218144 RepID=A0A430B7Y4_9ENTE|nr:multidrug effflux MFS transporter [Vagococcus carniphilus]QNN74255.1 multidrug effflux MFS transporter [Vagococcus carniphilus]RSU16441.1 Bcr/CflA family drug resistance efflux transporter [Vagococcus carniphilus]